jgi:hypothetical protein
MSDGLNDLLFTIRQHPSFKELLDAIECVPVKKYKPSEPSSEQTADWIFRSGRQLQDQNWRDFLIGPQTEKT